MPRKDDAVDLSSPAAATTRRAIRALFEGQEPQGATKATCGAWWPVVAGLQQALAQGGTPRVVEVFKRLAHVYPPLATLMLSEPAPEPLPLPPQCPPLPAAAASILAHDAPCGAWLDEYLAFAEAAAPMTPRSFHEAAGLFLASLAVGRRLVFYHGLTPFYPNLYFLWIGPTTLYRKSTAVAIFTNVLRRAGLQGLLLSEDITPEALLQELSLSIPETYPRWSGPRRDRWLAQRALAAQRAVLVDEASFLFDSLGHDYRNTLLSLLLRLYDCPEELSEHTIGRGLNLVERAYLSFFGITTPAGMQPHFRDPGLWAKGLWRRFVLILPDSKPVWQSPAGEHGYPAPLIAGLRRLHHLFPVPEAHLVESARGERHVGVQGAADPSHVTLAPGVASAWEAYCRATGHDMLLDGSIDELLHGCYGSLGTHAIKVAMLLAAMDTATLPVCVELRHFGRAVAIVESWRASLHRVWATGMVTEENRRAERIMAVLASAGSAGLTVRGPLPASAPSLPRGPRASRRPCPRRPGAQYEVQGRQSQRDGDLDRHTVAP